MKNGLLGKGVGRWSSNEVVWIIAERSQEVVVLKKLKSPVVLSSVAGKRSATNKTLV